MSTDRVWVLEDPDERHRVRKKKAPATPPRPQKNPAAAFSWSILIWGAGQIYCGLFGVGFLFILLMVNFYLDPILIWLYRDTFFAWLKSLAITSSQILRAATLFYLSGLLIWLLSAERAYCNAKAGRTHSFLGIKSKWIPAVCSMVLPGWGQFLNGQEKKGTLFLLIALVGFFAMPSIALIWLVWPHLETAAERLLWERVLLALIIATPIVLLLWLVNGFDALKISLDETKKEPVLKRLEYANYRRRMYGWGRGVFPSLKQTAILTLALIGCSAIAYFTFPHDYYVAVLQRLQTQLTEQQMVFLPELIGRLLQRA